tara:strand:+ start:411 stop:950 length:540 start_codon:yes stop_codon:yes gene_type:complete
MSRIGKKSISLPDKVAVTIDGLSLTIKGPKGQLSRTLPQGVSIAQEENTISISPISDKRKCRERHGLCRSLVFNMVEGVTKGYSRKLEIVGVGSRAQLKGGKLIVSAGYSHPIEVVPPNGITFSVENNTNVTVSGIDKELVGNEAAKIRAIRPPEPYKGKGIKFEGERIIRKAGKSGKK